jgi:hypothetical protein
LGGVLATIHDGRMWWFGATGDVDLAMGENERFQTFVRSVKFSSEGGAENEE